MKNKQIIDYEEGRITIRVTKTIYFLLQSDIAHFNFKDNKGEYNENIFYNTILSIMAKDRIKQQEKLKRKLELEISETINKGMKEKVLSTIVAEMYAVIHSMIMDLTKDGTFSKEKAEIVNKKSADSLKCKPLSLEE